MSRAADQIRIEQEKLNEIRQEAARRMQKDWEDIQDKARARIDAGRDGGLDEGKAEEQRRADAQRKTDQDDRAQRFEDQAKRDQANKDRRQKSDEQRQSDQRKADQQRKDDQQKEDHRAEARSKARDETERMVKEGLEQHVADRQEKVMAGSSTGPAMTPRVMNDPVAMAAALDHPALTDDQKLILSKAGYAVGEGWHNREAERKEQLMQGERDKRDDDRTKGDARSDRANGDQGREGQQKQGGRPDFFEEVLSKERDRTQADHEKQTPERNGDHTQARDGQRQEQGRPDFFEQHFSRSQDRTQSQDRTPEQRAAEAVQERDKAVSDAKENIRPDHEDMQVGETAQDKGDRAALESTGKVTVAQAEEMTHGKGSKEHADQQFERWFDKHETQELDKAGVSRDPADYEREDER